MISFSVKKCVFSSGNKYRILKSEHPPAIPYQKINLIEGKVGRKKECNTEG
jgi:hypothetical protein